MKKIYIPILCILSLVASSCSDFLDVRPGGEQVENAIFENAKGFESAIYGVYGSMASKATYGKDLVWGIPEIQAQNLYSGSEENVALAKYDYENNADLRARFLGVWTDAYQTIGFANNVLKNLDKKSKADLPLYDMYRGEMLAVRAMHHFDLVRMFAPTDKSKRGIPYVTSYSFSVRPFSTVGEVYQALVKDLTEAEQLLANENLTYPRKNDYYSRFNNWRETHMNIYAVQALLARVHWYFGDNAKAALYAEKVINSGKFPLMDVTEIESGIQGVLSPKETIFGIYAPKFVDTAQSYLYASISFFSYDPYDNLSGASYLQPWDALFNLDVASTVQDFRRNQFRRPNGGVSGPSRCWKLVDWKKIEKSADNLNISGVSLINVSEMYLIAADALFASAPDRAFKYFNAETSSRGLTPLNSVSDLTAEKIFNEFHKETYCLGQHWYNMKRLGSDIISNHESRTIPGNEEIYTVPVPKEEFEYRPQ